MSAVSAHYATRLDLAKTREFANPGAGRARRSRLAAQAREFLVTSWDEAMRSVGLPSRLPGVALAVVGSQARGDAGPLSDYDIVLLHDGNSASSRRIDAVANALWYPMWDAGIRFDHSVRTLGECRRVAGEDLAATVGMLDIAPVAGDEVIVAGVRESIAHDWRGAARQRLPELVASLKLRHERFGDLATTQEPDLKEAGGGLRDHSLVAALTRAWLADPNRVDLDAAHETLLDVRDALHVVTGRGREKLALQDQDAVAALLGLHDADELLTAVVDASRTISYVVDGAIRAAGQSQRARRLRVGPRKPTMTPLGHGLHLHDGEVVLGPGPRATPTVQLLRAATAAAHQEVRIAPTTLANLVAALEPLPEPWPQAEREAFVEFLAAGPGLVEVWEALDRAHVIDRWIPEWAAVRSRPQRNAVHRFTVDRHSVEAVVQAAPLRSRVARPDLLMMAALLHDIGKVAGNRDHAAEGAPVARRIVARVGFAPEDVEVLERLVREHLTLVDLATKRDPDDLGTITTLRDAVEGRLDVLDLLAALTESDAKAAGPQAWTSWRAGLVSELYRRGQEHLSSDRHPGADLPVSDDPVLLPPDVASAVRAGDVVVRIEQDDVGADPAHGVGTTTGAIVTIYDADRPGLFADMAGLIASRRTSVRSATLRTIGGIAVNTWRIESPLGVLPDGEELTRSLRALREGDRRPVRALEARRDRGGSTLKAASMPAARAFVVPRASADSTVIEVRAADRPGLLFDVGSAFARAGASVRSAHIATYAGQSADTFYVTNLSGAALGPPEAAHVIGEVIDAASAT